MEERIKTIVEYSHLSTTNFADTIGISRSALVHLLSGRNQPSLDVLRKILNVFPELSVDWIMFGHGQMLKDEKISSTRLTTASDFENSNQPDLFGGFSDSDEDVDSTSSKSDNDSKVVQRIINNNVIPQSLVTRKEKNKQLSERKITKIVFFYSDNSFEEFKKIGQ